MDIMQQHYLQTLTMLFFSFHIQLVPLNVKQWEFTFLGKLLFKKTKHKDGLKSNFTLGTWKSLSSTYLLGNTSTLGTTDGLNANARKAKPLDNDSTHRIHLHLRTNLREEQKQPSSGSSSHSKLMNVSNRNETHFVWCAPEICRTFHWFHWGTKRTGLSPTN